MVTLTLTPSAAAFTSKPKRDLTPHTVAYLQHHRDVLVNLLLADRAGNEIATGIAACAEPANGTICGAPGTHRKLDGSWLCQQHGTAWADALWPPVDPTTATALCRAVVGQDGLNGELVPL